MNEQKKRELTLRFAVENNGGWSKFPADSIPNDEEPLVLLCKESYFEDGEYIKGFLYAGFDGFNKNLFDRVCTRDEFETFIESLFEGAPDDAEYYLAPSSRTYPAWIKDLNNGECKYRVIINTNLQEHTDKDWHSLNSDIVLKSGSLITRPRKQEVEQVEQVEWEPEVGQDCMISYDGCEFFKGKYIGDNNVGSKCYMVFFVPHKGDYVNYKRNSDVLEFRPLKTEAEKERERLAVRLFTEMTGSDLSSDDIKTTALYENCLRAIDAGWRPSKD